jgi:predicted membrane protein
MASPYQPAAPLPPPPPVYRYRRSLAGPLVLILIGGVFLLRNFGVHLPVWHFFGRFWPLLIILWGVIALVEHFTSLRHGYQTRHLGGGGIFLLILIVIVGLAAHHSSDVNWEGMRDQIQIDDDLGGMFGKAFTFDDTVEQQFPKGASLRVVSDRGAINITPADGNTIRVVVHKKLYANNQDDANRFNEGSKPLITVNGTQVLLNANTNGAGDHAVQADMDIFVPRDAAVDVASKRGDVSISDRKADAKLAVQRGDITLSEVAGNAKMSLDKGSIRASNITGDVEVEGRVDNVTLEDVKGAVRLNGDFFNDIRLSKISKTVEFKSARSDITLASVPGDLEISGDSLRATDVGGPMRFVTRSKDIHLEGVTGDVEVENANGEIEIHPADKLPIGKMVLTGKHGDITVVLPGNAGFQLEATTHKGDITSDFGSVKIEDNNGSSHATGTVGNGITKLQINADTGDIRINKG